MAPHALGQQPDSTVNSVHESSHSKVHSNIKLNPFESTIDPYLLGKSSYSSPITIINQAIFSTSDKIFSYETVGDSNLVDSHLQTWINQYGKTNGFGKLPAFRKFQIRSGASKVLQGFNGDGKDPISVLTDLNGFNYMYPNLVKTNLPLAINLAAIDYDDHSKTLVSNYEKGLNLARKLNYPVVNAVNTFDGKELQFLTVLNQYLVKLSGSPSINLFEGLNAVKTFSKYDVVSVEDLTKIVEQLPAADVDSSNLNSIVNFGLDKLNSLFGTNYGPFEYIGNPRPTTVFVVYGTNASTNLQNVFEGMGDFLKTGLIQIRIPVPFDTQQFINLIPKTVEKLVILNPNGVETSIKADISSALFLSGVYNRYDLQEFKYDLDFNWTPITITKVLSEFITIEDPNIILKPNLDSVISSSSHPLTANSSPVGNYAIWGKDNGEFYSVAEKIAFTLSLDDTKRISYRTKFDNYTDGGIFQSQIVSGNLNQPVNEIDSSELTIIEDISVLNSYDIVSTTKPGSKILIGNYSKYDETKVLEKLNDQTRTNLINNGNELIVIDFSIFDELTDLKDSTKGFSNEFLIQLGFWKFSFPELGPLLVNKLLQGGGSGFELLAVVVDKFIEVVEKEQGLKSLEVKEQPKEEPKEESKEEETVEEDELEIELPFFIKENSFAANPREVYVPDLEETNVSGYLQLAQKLTFQEPFKTTQALRPELPVQNFVVKVKENIRLTPQEYSRNIFHIEFDVSGTGLTYEIGEALGIHGRNSAKEVEKFLEFYNVDGDSLVEVINKDDPSLIEIKTARQCLTETVDFLGKPPKKFYESLAEFAGDESEFQKLSKLGSGEGAEDLKKLQDVEFATYFDILEEYKSARPPFADLVKIISPMKRREYSIASSQKLHPDALHLLIVVVDWVDAKGRTRFGQCSKYLSDLGLGDELVVSVKKSVMKLPPLSTQPIVMSGLGTGLAPFKAFIEEKIWQQQQGMEIGEIYLYMGSRHKKEEYLYGELWEAYQRAGILTHIGAAFSRDQPQKIYIQDKIRESLEELTTAIVDKNGSFYLCGPTWPVPDITACLSDIIINAATKKGETIKDINKVIEDMKEDGRYILEVY